MDKISVIVPVYNVKEYLKECIDSILSQTYRNMEIILVDDGSTDGSGDICDEYAQDNEMIKVIHKENGGLSSARNKGLESITGEYIGFVDSDDVLSIHMYSELYTNMKKYNAEIVICNMCNTIDSLDNVEIRHPKVLNQSKALGALSKAKPFGSHACNKLFDSKIIKNIKFPEQKTYEDLYTIYKWISNANKIVYLDRCLYYYRPNPKGITRVDFSKSNMDMIYGNLELLNYMRGNYRCNVKYVRMSLAKASVALLRKISLSSEVEKRYIVELQRYLRWNIVYLLIGPYNLQSKLFGCFAAINYKAASVIYRKLEKIN